jgi:hypothetical protein
VNSLLLETVGDEVKKKIFPRVKDGNGTNQFGYVFQDYYNISLFRLGGQAFLQGANSSYYAPNASVCLNNLLNLI